MSPSQYSFEECVLLRHKIRNFAWWYRNISWPRSQKQSSLTLNMLFGQKTPFSTKKFCLLRTTVWIH